MANSGADGSIIIDTELDNTGFNKGSDKLLTSVQNLTDAVNNLGDKITGAFNAMLPVLQTVADSTNNIYSALTSEGQQAAAAVTGVTGAMEGAATGAQRFQSGVTGADRGAAALGRTIDKLSAGMVNGFSSAGAVLRFKANLDAAEQQAASLKSRMEQLAQTRIPTDEYKEIQAAVAKADQALLNLYNRQDKMSANGVKQNSRQWRSLQYDIQLAEAEVARMRAALATLEGSGKAFTTGADTEQYQALEAQLQSANEQIERGKALIDAEALSQAQLNVQAAQEAVIRATTAEERQAALARLQEAQNNLNNLAAQLANGGEQSPDENVSAWDRFRAALETARNAMQNTYQAEGLLVKGARLMRDGLQKVAQTAWSATKSLAQMAKNLLTFNRHGKQATLTSKGLVKTLTGVITMLKSRIKRMFITYLMSEIKQAMSALVRYSSTLDASVSSMRNALTGLSANVGVAFSNLINAIAPVITQIINLISTAVSYLNAFFAMLSGKSTVTVAKKQTDSYADSLNNAAGASKNLRKENKLLGFDELNILSKDKDSSGSGGGAKGPSELYEDVPIDKLLPEDVSSWFDSIKDAFEKGDWEGIGTTISEGLNRAVSRVNTWVKKDLKPAAKKWGKNIAKLLNGLVDGFDGKTLGDTVAEGMNTVIGAVDSFMEEFEFRDLGEKIGQTVRGWVEAIDLDAVARILSNGLNGIADMLGGFLSENPFEGLGEKISSAINLFIQNTNWEELGKNFSEFFIQLLDLAITTLEGVDWVSLGHAIGDFIGGIDWPTVLAKAAELLWEGLKAALMASFGIITGLFDSENGPCFIALLTAIIGLKWAFTGASAAWSTAAADLAAAGMNPLLAIPGTLTVLAKNIGIAALGVADAMLIAYDVSQLKEAADTYAAVANAHSLEVDKALEAYKTLYEKRGKETADAWAASAYEIDTTNMTIDEALGALTTKIDSYFEDVPENMWEGFKAGWNTYFGEGGKGLGALLGDAFGGAVDWVKDLLGIHSPSTVFEDIGINLVNGLLNGLNTWSSVTTFLGGAVEGIKTTLSTAWGNIKTTASTEWGKIKDTISTTFNPNVSNTLNGLETDIATAWNNVKTTAENKWTEIKDTTTSLWRGLKDEVSKEDWTSIGGSLVSGLKNGITSAWSGLTTKVSNLCQQVTKTAKSALGVHSPSKVFAEIGEFLDEGLVVGLQSGESNVMRSVRTLAGNVADTMSDTNPEVELAGNATLAGMDSVAGALGGIADKFSAIATMLTNMGGLRVPSVAAGTVIPYQARMAGNSKDTLENTVTASNEELISVIIQSVTNATAAIVEAIQSSGNRTASLDMNDLTTRIIDNINSRTLRSGRPQLL